MHFPTLHVWSLLLLLVAPQKAFAVSRRGYPFRDSKDPEEHLDVMISGIASSPYTWFELGTPKKLFRASIDTLMPFTWVYNSGLIEKYHPAFEYDRSTTVKLLNASSKDIRLGLFKRVGSWLNGGASLFGFLISDRITIGQYEIKDQPITVVSDLEVKMPCRRKYLDYFYLQYSSVLGLALNDDYKSPIIKLYKKKLVPAPMFSLWMPKTSFHGDLYLGRLDEDSYVGEMIWVDVQNFQRRVQKFKPAFRFLPWGTDNHDKVYKAWTWKLLGSIGSIQKIDTATSTLEHTIHASGNAIMDTASRYIRGPPELVDIIIKAAKAEDKDEGLWVVSCDQDFTQLPTVEFRSSTEPRAVFKIKPSDYILRKEINGKQGRIPLCYLGIIPTFQNCIDDVYNEQETNGGQYESTLFQAKDTWYLGQTFLAKYYTAYDFGGKKIGFAGAAEKPDRVETTGTGQE